MININYRDSRSIYEQVRDNFRQLIISGVLPPASKIPSVKELAANLAINPNTIQRAYTELENEGYIFSVPGRGSFVCEDVEIIEAKRTELLKKFMATAAELQTFGYSVDKLVEMLKGEKENDRAERA